MKLKTISISLGILALSGIFTGLFISSSNSYATDGGTGGANTKEELCSYYKDKKEGNLYSIPSSEKVPSTDWSKSFQVAFLATNPKLKAKTCHVDGATFAGYQKSEADYTKAMQYYLGSEPLKIVWKGGNPGSIPIVHSKNETNPINWASVSFNDYNPVKAIDTKVKQCKFGQEDVYLSKEIVKSKDVPLHLPMVVEGKSLSNPNGSVAKDCGSSPTPTPTPKPKPADNGGGQGHVTPHHDKLKSVKTGSDLFSTRNIAVSIGALALGGALVYSSYRLKKRQ